MPPLFRVLRPLLVATLFACVATSIGQFLQTFSPTWNPTYLTICVFLISLEAFLAAEMVRRLRLSGSEWWTFRVAEWIVILFVLKLLSYAAPGWRALVADMALWQEDPTTIFSLEYVVAVALAFFSWLSSTDIAHWLDDLTQEPNGPGFSPVASLGSLQATFFTGGVIIVAMAGLTQVGLQLLFQMDRPPVGGVIINVLIYFVVGLLLLSQARLEVLYSRWDASGIQVQPSIKSRWAMMALVSLALVALAALLLPTRYSLGLLDTAAWVLGFLGNLLLLVGYLLNLLLFYILGLLASLLNLFTPIPPPNPIPPVMPDFGPAVPQQRWDAPAWWALARSILFWITMYLIIGYAVWQFIGTRRAWWVALARLPLVGWLVTTLAALFGGLRTAATSASQAVRRRLAHVPAPPLPPRQWLRLGVLSPRELLMYFYLSTVRRAGEVGLPRRSDQTAREYAAYLREQLPEGEQDVATLNDAFEVARYSARPINKTDTATPRLSWERIKRALRARRGDVAS